MLFLDKITTYLKARRRSFGYAFKGLRYFFQKEAHAQIHLVAAIFALAFAYFLEISRQEWAILILCIALVISLEAINTALERLTDLASPDWHPLAAQVKDIAAAAVLIAAIAALFIGLLIFLPYLLAQTS